MHIDTRPPVALWVIKPIELISHVAHLRQLASIAYTGCVQTDICPALKQHNCLIPVLTVSS